LLIATIFALLNLLREAPNETIFRFYLALLKFVWLKRQEENWKVKVSF